MFDDLHDPDPPIGDSHNFAAVAERAQAMRRRRSAALATVCAAGLIAVGAVIIGAIPRDGQSQLATLEALPEVQPGVTDVSPSASAPMTSLPSVSAPATTTIAASATPVSTIPVAPSSTISETSTTAPPESSAPTTVPVVSAIVGEPQPLECGSFRVCTYDHLADGRLVQVGKDGSEAGPPTFTIYDTSSTGVAATGMLGNFDPLGAFLVDIGPGDIAYVWYTPRNASETARMGAFELTGPEAGRQIIEFEAVLDFSGDTEQVPTRAGFVNVGCCDAGAERPAPDAEVVIPWVDRDGNPITNDLDTFFSTEFRDQVLTITASRGDEAQSWSLAGQPAPPRGMAMLHQLNDGRILYVAEPTGTTARSAQPIYLNPDGTIDAGSPAGAIIHVLPDGRAALRDVEGQTYALATLTDPIRVEPEDPTASTTTVTPSPPAESASQPLVAITDTGDAVYFGGSDAEPTLIFDGPVDGANRVERVGYSESEQRLIVARCCDQAVGQITTVGADDLPMAPDSALPADQTGEPHVLFDGFGVAPALDSTGTIQASITGEGRSVFVTDAANDAFAERELPPEAGDIVDLVWNDDTTIVALGRFQNLWTISAVLFDGGELGVESSEPFGLTSDFDDLVFAGVAVDGEIAVHDRATDEVLSGTIDDYGNNNVDKGGSSLTVITLPGPALSAWFVDPGQLIWVDTEQALRVGDRIIPGEYTWARR